MRRVPERRLFYPIAVSAGVLAVFVAIGKLANSLNRKRLGSFLRFLLAAGIIVYIFFAYTQEIASAFDAVKGELLGSLNSVENTDRGAREHARELSESLTHLK